MNEIDNNKIRELDRRHDAIYKDYKKLGEEIAAITKARSAIYQRNADEASRAALKLGIFDATWVYRPAPQVESFTDYAVFCEDKDLHHKVKTTLSGGGIMTMDLDKGVRLSAWSPTLSIVFLAWSPTPEEDAVSPEEFVRRVGLRVDVTACNNRIRFLTERRNTFQPWSLP